MAAEPSHVLYVCTLCGAADGRWHADNPGQRLYEAAARSSLPPGLKVEPVQCLAGCDRGGAIALSHPHKKQYILIGQSVETLNDLLAAAKQYVGSASGQLYWDDLGPGVVKKVHGKIPAPQ